jgi:glycosyltransferase involved in cell wall biosynthesis
MRVAVVMSTYQGERYVEEQIASILPQLPPDGWLLVRDDGSRDATAARVEAIADPRIRLVRGENIGFARSFFALLASVPPEAGLVLLADQDDVWLPDKVERARRALAGREGPALCFSRLWLVDEALQRIGVTPAWPRGPSFENALAENIVTGCTIALNPAALRLVLQRGDERRIHFHDWWIYLVVSAFGTVVADEEPTVNYRQHGGNTVGGGSGWQRYLVPIQFMRRHSWVHVMYNQIENFRAAHGANLPSARRAWIDRYFDARRAGSVLRLLFTPRRHRQRLVDDVLLRALVLWEIVRGRGLLPREFTR